jgi:hypothetical protein
VVLPSLTQRVVPVLSVVLVLPGGHEYVIGGGVLLLLLEQKAVAWVATSARAAAKALPEAEVLNSVVEIFDVAILRACSTVLAVPVANASAKPEARPYAVADAVAPLAEHEAVELALPTAEATACTVTETFEKYLTSTTFSAGTIAAGFRLTGYTTLPQFLPVLPPPTLTHPDGDALEGQTRRLWSRKE